MVSDSHQIPDDDQISEHETDGELSQHFVLKP